MFFFKIKYNEKLKRYFKTDGNRIIAPSIEDKSICISVNEFESLLKICFKVLFFGWNTKILEFLLPRFKDISKRLFFSNNVRYFNICILYRYFLNKDTSKFYFMRFLSWDDFFAIDHRIYSLFQFLRYYPTKLIYLNLFYYEHYVPIYRIKKYYLRIDFFVFLYLAALTEYIRLFKYNEYLTHHINVTNKPDIYYSLAKQADCYMYYLPFLDFKIEVFYNRYITYMLPVIFYKKIFNYEYSFSQLELSFPFLKFFIIFSSFKSLIYTIQTYFLFHVVINIYLFLYKSFFIFNRITQRLDFMFIDRLYYTIYDFQKSTFLSTVNKKMLSLLYKSIINDYNVKFFATQA